MPTPRITFLESTLPWEYRNWDRKTDAIANHTCMFTPSILQKDRESGGIASDGPTVTQPHQGRSPHS